MATWKTGWKGWRTNGCFAFVRLKLHTHMQNALKRVESRQRALARFAYERAVSTARMHECKFISFAGSLQSQTEGFGTLYIAMGLSVLFVYMVLASQFGSFLQPLVIMLAMPFSFIGAFIALIATGTELDITGMIGMIMLLGLVTKNSILLVDFTNNLRKAGMARDRAIERSGAVRLRPIIMTTLAIVVGALPTALGIHIFSAGEGGEFRRGLAIVLIGGLLTSMVLTLLVVPVAYSLLDSATSRFSQRMHRPEPVSVSAEAGEPVGAAD